MNHTELNANVAECLRDVLSFGSKTVVNICTGTEVAVPYGFWDWAIGGAIGTMVFAILSMLAYVAYDNYKDNHK